MPIDPSQRLSLQNANLKTPIFGWTHPAHPPDGIKFMDKPVVPVAEMKLVGFVFDPKMTMVPMINYVARQNDFKQGAKYQDGFNFRD